MATKFLNPLSLLVLAIFYVQKPHHFSENTRESSNLNLVATLGRKNSLHLGYEAFYQRINSKISLNSSTSSNSGLLFLSILLLSGDIQPNPGPNWRYPSGACTKPVKVNQKGVQCDVCDHWYHTKCCSMGDETYNTLANTPYVWLCVNCDQPSYSEPELSLDLSLHNSFSTLCSESLSSSQSEHPASSSTPQSNPMFG